VAEPSGKQINRAQQGIWAWRVKDINSRNNDGDKYVEQSKPMSPTDELGDQLATRRFD